MVYRQCALAKTFTIQNCFQEQRKKSTTRLGRWLYRHGACCRSKRLRFGSKFNVACLWQPTCHPRAPKMETRDPWRKVLPRVAISINSRFIQRPGLKNRWSGTEEDCRNQPQAYVNLHRYACILTLICVPKHMWTCTHTYEKRKGKFRTMQLPPELSLFYAGITHQQQRASALFASRSRRQCGSPRSQSLLLSPAQLFISVD